MDIWGPPEGKDYKWYRRESKGPTPMPTPEEIAGLMIRDYEAHHCPLIGPY